LLPPDYESWHLDFYYVTFHYFLVGVGKSMGLADDEPMPILPDSKTHSKPANALSKCIKDVIRSVDTASSIYVDELDSCTALTIFNGAGLEPMIAVGGWASKTK
jgi:hypothetical protein